MTHTILWSAAAALALGAAPADAITIDAADRFGPPWISVEYPANPHHPSTRDASFLIRTYHHTNAIEPAVRAVAEGLVDGQRRTVRLDVAPTLLPGVYAVNCDLPAEGAWIVAVTLDQGGGSTATALVRMDHAGRVAGVEVPSRTTGDGWVVPIDVQTADIEERLRSADRLGDAGPASNRALQAGAAGVLALGLLAGVRRRQSR